MRSAPADRLYSMPDILNALSRSSLALLIILILSWFLSYEDGTWNLFLIYHLLPIPLAFFLWSRLLERERKLTSTFSVIAAVASLGGSVLGTLYILNAQKYPPLIGTAITIVSVTIALFSFCSFRECLSRACSDFRAACIAIACGLSGPLYLTLVESNSYIGFHVTSWTAQSVSYLAEKAVEDTQVVFFNYPAYDKLKPLVEIKSPYFTLLVAPVCSGLEGMSIFVLLLSIMLLLDWHVFRGGQVWSLYALAGLYVFCVNVLRVLSIYLLGHWAYLPNAGVTSQFLRDIAVESFHSYYGAILYPIAYAAFAAWIYGTVGRRGHGKGARRPPGL